MHPETHCAADDDGRACYRPPVMVRPVALCAPHKAELALAIVPDLLRDQLAAAHRAHAGSGLPDQREDIIDNAVAVPHQRLLNGEHHEPVVYFIANGGKVKIGYTTNLKNRLSSLALRADSVLVALDGGPDLERALHGHFAARRSGNTEWFELAPDIFRYIAARQSGHVVEFGEGVAIGLNRSYSIAEAVRAAVIERGANLEPVVSHVASALPDARLDSIRREAMSK